MLLFPPKPSFSPSSLKLFTRTHNPKILLQNLSGYPRKYLGIVSCCRNSGCLVSDDGSEAELERMVALLPEEIRCRLRKHPELDKLMEVVMDLGRTPLARFPSGDYELSDCPITFQDLEFATSQVGDFAIDNRAGLSRTLHRISAIRNRKNAIIGLTCRVGRAITGSADLLRDLVKDGASLLLIGPPGVGKTTIIREIARMLADDYEKRVMIVDTSNEIGGDGDIPHAGIGSARRMQVPNADMQHMVLIEAVENHMPQAIVIDEIGTKLEAMAASTIAQRGIQLVASAHGITIENLIKNPALDMLIGGIQSVTLGDEEASRRRVQKTILERKGPSTFHCAVELISKSELRVHRSLEATVDAILAGRCPDFTVRKVDFHGLQGMEVGEPLLSDSNGNNVLVEHENVPFETAEIAENNHLVSSATPHEERSDDGKPLCIFVYGILEATVVQGIKKLNLDDEVELTDNMSEADVLLALQSKLKKNPGIQAVAKSHDKPLYVTKTSSLVQITKALRTLMADYEDSSMSFESEGRFKSSERIDALEEARIAIEKVVILKGETVELLPRPSHILSLQVDLAQKYQLQSEIVGLGPESRLRIIPVYTNTNGKQKDREVADDVTTIDESLDIDDNANGSLYTLDRLPLLPD
ncbi:protein SEEDLING PLASTID DEVELOPMENT 1 [Amaranthus tricolor]|uniref:protein SEEDLING PLASTID DEVELOPMENT 1 n=1 Tax=Amaranthus tricolor TaxID=29722 RepID=UPI002583B025|nr:protein SEEDLING PLASTID DEVELOPMENT 1 [Amaranthus tricolor]